MDILTIIAILFVTGLAVFIALKFILNKKKKNKEVDLSKYVVNYSEIEDEIRLLINQYRVSKNLTPVTYNNFISYKCSEHVDYCMKQGKISHDNFPQRSSEIYNGISAKAIGEVIAYGYTEGQGVVNAWKKSSTHNDILITPSFNRLGISVKESGRKMYVVVMFAKV